MKTLSITVFCPARRHVVFTHATACERLDLLGDEVCHRIGFFRTDLVSPAATEDALSPPTSSAPPVVGSACTHRARDQAGTF